jgi:hypothetical protein
MGARKLTFSSACSTPVAIWFSVVSASYSEGSIWSSLSTGSAVLTLNFLTLTLREDMVAGWWRVAESQRKTRKKIRSSHKTRLVRPPHAIFEMQEASWWPFFDGTIVAFDEVTLGLFCRAKIFHPSAGRFWGEGCNLGGRLKGHLELAGKYLCIQEWRARYLLALGPPPPFFCLGTGHLAVAP